MTKLLKGLSARNFTGSEEFISSPQLAAFSQAGAAAAPTVRSLALEAAANSFADDSVLKGVDSVEGEYTVIDCPAGKELFLFHRAQQAAGDDFSAFAAMPSVIAAEDNLVVVVGGSVSGVLSAPGETDHVSVDLVAGQTYSISLRSTGPNPVGDVFVEVFNPSDVAVGHDDDGGNGLNSILTITAAATGTYVIDVTAFTYSGSPGVGDYTVDVRQQTVDTVGNTNGTAVAIGYGTHFGFLETGSGAVGNPTDIAPTLGPVGAGDMDRYAVNLVAGQFYTFQVSGSADYESGSSTPTGTLDTVLVLRNAAGAILEADDDNGFPSDISSAFSFLATTTGTYYLDVQAYNGDVGGYVLDVNQVDLTVLDPLDAIRWYSADNIDTVNVAGTPTAYVYFGVAGETFGEPGPSYGWTVKEKSAIMEALLEFSKITGIQYAETANVAQAEFRLFTTTSTQFGAYFYPQDAASYGPQQGIGAFNVNSGGWDKPGVSAQDIPGDQVSLDKGGFSFAVVLHEFGHAHGLAHPHDNGGGSGILAGVFDSTLSAPASFDGGTYGAYDLNQGVYTVMSYNDAWDFHPDGPSPFTISGIDNGWSASLSAFDIAVLQERYGVHAYNATDTVYTLTDVIDDAFYETIWDSGGTDTIAYGGNLNATIDLTAATLDYTATGAGVLSFLDAPGASNLRGGYTIAATVVIENATGGNGADVLIGNSAPNVLSGNAGADIMIGRGGDDTLNGGAANDTARYDGNRADYTIQAVITNGAITGFTITDDNLGNGNEGTDTLNGVETAQFADVSVALTGAVAVFDGDGDLVSVHTTIQAAIDAATTLDGYTVFISRGVYFEDVNVTKDLTLIGANDGLAGDDPSRGLETSVRSFVITASGVTIDGVEVFGSDNISPPFDSGVYVIGNDFSLVNSRLAGPDTAVAIVTQVTTGLDVGDNLFTGYAIGMYISSGDSTGSVHDNHFQGAGGPLTGMGNGVNSETSGVIIQNNTFDGLYSGSLNLFPFGPDPVDLNTYVIGNSFTDTVDRPIQIFPTADSTHFIGTNHNEAFRGDAGVAGVSLGYEGNGGDDRAFGGTEADDFSGGAGLDQLFGAGGDDTLNGGADNDLLDGEAGIDTAEFADASVAYTDTLLGWLITSSEGNDFLQNVEIVVEGSGQRNLLVGSTGFATIQAASDEAQTDDNIRLAAGSYSGTVTYDVDGLTVIGQPGSQQNVTYTTGTGFGITVYGANLVDTITTGDGDDNVFGGGGNDVIATGNGNDSLNGDAGDDTMTGGQGHDTYHVLQPGDVVIEAPGGGTDIIFTAVSYSLNDGSEVEVLATRAFDGIDPINLTGNGLDNYMIGNDGPNQLDGKAGADVMVGRAGHDTYTVDNPGDQVVEDAGGGSDIVFTSVSYALNDTWEVEVLATRAFDGTDPIDLTGNGLDNYMIGNDGANTMDGKGGSDVLVGRAGQDTFAFTTTPGAGNVDYIFEFVTADDTIALDSEVFGLPDGPLDPSAFVVGPAATTADHRIIYNAGQLYYDEDGMGGEDQVLFAVLQNAPIITNNEFTVI